jgi:lipopolysaccharide/colanic/teichoic acid biosynthesis glycosyltransferase
MMKRGFDLASSIFALLLFSPLLLLVALLIVCDDGRPIFFTQLRLGRCRCPIPILKFRTMRAERVTRVGRWLRGTGIDEIPQFVNVLRGEMSVVGPRPLRQSDVDRLEWNEARYLPRWDVLPGITGLAQLYNDDGARKSWYFDRLYLRIQSIRLDAGIVILSFLVNVFGKRRVRDWLRRKSRWTLATSARG